MLLGKNATITMLRHQIEKIEEAIKIVNIMDSEYTGWVVIDRNVRFDVIKVSGKLEIDTISENGNMRYDYSYLTSDGRYWLYKGRETNAHNILSTMFQDKNTAQEQLNLYLQKSIEKNNKECQHYLDRNRWLQARIHDLYENEEQS